jgi:hypothetical protein
MSLPARMELSAGLRSYLYLTAALCGAAILIVEILGAKMLSPYFGTSHFVWTAQIAVTLMSLACGRHGGCLVDRSQIAPPYLCIHCGGTGLSVPFAGWLRSCRERNRLGSLLASLFVLRPAVAAGHGGPVPGPGDDGIRGTSGRWSAGCPRSHLRQRVGTVDRLCGDSFMLNSVTMFATSGLLLPLGSSTSRSGDRPARLPRSSCCSSPEWRARGPTDGRGDDG